MHSKIVAISGWIIYASRFINLDSHRIQESRTTRVQPANSIVKKAVALIFRGNRVEGWIFFKASQQKIPPESISENCWSPWKRFSYATNRAWTSRSIFAPIACSTFFKAKLVCKFSQNWTGAFWKWPYWLSYAWSAIVIFWIVYHTISRVSDTKHIPRIWNHHPRLC